MATWTDDFNRANENLVVSPNWDDDLNIDDAMAVSSNDLYLRGGSGRQGSALLAASTFTTADEQTAQGIWTTAGTCLGGLVVRGTQGTNQLSGYGIEVKATEIKLYSYVVWTFSHLAGAPSRNLIGTWTSAVSPTDVIKLTATGTTIAVLVNTVERISVTDTDHSSGQPGFAISTSAGTFPHWDDFEATTPDPPSGGGTPFSIGIDGSWNRNMGHP